MDPNTRVKMFYIIKRQTPTLPPPPQTFKFLMINKIYILKYTLLIKKKSGAKDPPKKELNYFPIWIQMWATSSYNHTEGKMPKVLVKMASIIFDPH